ncbi:ectonucleotide pyrophosphatase/phosphodiesterase [Alkalisalibacterium limincola]|nr:ectonucleotide pyrophosphatase/phosphodiesterase [Alkalisalibacterium limincola]
MFAFSLALAPLLAACTAAPPPIVDEPPLGQPAVVLVSLDGFHPDYLFRGNSPHLDALAERGVRARWMQPAYPTLTFPNHYTLVTGLRPDRHGIVDNTMQDPELGGFWLSNRDAVGDGRWWSDGEPVWITANAHGLRSATMFWPGSEADIAGRHPDHWHPYDGSVAKDDRVGQLLAWLDLPAGERPHFMTLYFEHVDSVGHAVGPEDERIEAAVRDVDAAVGNLLQGIAARGLEDEVNLVFVSDHGMAQTSPERVVFVDELIPPGSASIVSIGSALGLNPREGRAEELEAALLGRHERFECWRREDMPARWHFGSHPRVPALMCQADTGWRFISRERAARRPGGWEAGFNLGSHGFDPADPSMRALFIAAGPDIAERRVVEPFEAIHVQPFLLRLLGIAPLADVDGDAAVLDPALAGRRRR